MTGVAVASLRYSLGYVERGFLCGGLKMIDWPVRGSAKATPSLVSIFGCAVFVAGVSASGGKPPVAIGGTGGCAIGAGTASGVFSSGFCCHPLHGAS
jgi:hypothetical protein